MFFLCYTTILTIPRCVPRHHRRRRRYRAYQEEGLRASIPEGLEVQLDAIRLLHATHGHDHREAQVCPTSRLYNRPR